LFLAGGVAGIRSHALQPSQILSPAKIRHNILKKNGLKTLKILGTMGMMSHSAKQLSVP
jgi:hypothetical protein